MKYFSILTWIIGFVCCLSSCQNDLTNIKTEVEPGDPVEISVLSDDLINTLRSIGPDEEINSVRILAFHSGTGYLKYNSGKLDLNIVSIPLKIQITTGTYDFVFIANEHSVDSDELTLHLDQWTANSNTTLYNLDNEYFKFNGFSGLKDIPATSIYRNVRVMGDRNLTYYNPGTNSWVTLDGNINSIWEAYVERAAIRVDLDIHIEKTLSTDITGISFANVPDKVPFFSNKMSDNTTIYYESGYSTTYPLTHIPISEFVKDDSDQEGMYEYILERIILPASVFEQPTSVNKGITIEVHLASTPNKPMKAVIGRSVPDDYTSPRNTHYRITGRVENNAALLDVVPEDWTPESISGNSGNRKLNVERISASVCYPETTRIHFWSNQPEVIVDEICYAGNTGNTEYSVNDLFTNLCGPAATNFFYDPLMGSGYMDIKLTNHPDTPDVVRIYLNASGLRREITLIIDK